jgi:hypothetical protein
MDFAAGVFLSEAQNPIPSPPCTLYWGGGGKGEPDGRGERGAAFHKAGSKIPT